ncbi:Hypothetical predicted protein [Mytilus galloprovincialis]|uniref:Uncharacterized protein n=1 Tax=Mytilus galloprovincialis TaxID=29158 RepID=A0A8B6CCP3_MYTGA|nr:Hypothetical predicted protein [Mytilus galloprovincialis]
MKGQNKNVLMKRGQGKDTKEERGDKIQTKNQMENKKDTNKRDDKKETQKKKKEAKKRGNGEEGKIDEEDLKKRKLENKLMKELDTSAKNWAASKVLEMRNTVDTPENMSDFSGHSDNDQLLNSTPEKVNIPTPKPLLPLEPASSYSSYFNNSFSPQNFNQQLSSFGYSNYGQEYRQAGSQSNCTGQEYRQTGSQSNCTDKNTGKQGLNTGTRIQAKQDHNQTALDKNTGKQDHNQTALDKNTGKQDHNQTALDKNTGKQDHNQTALDKNTGKQDHNQTALDKNTGKQDHNQTALDKNTGKQDHNQTALSQFHQWLVGHLTHSMITWISRKQTNQELSKNLPVQEVLYNGQSMEELKVHVQRVKTVSECVNLLLNKLFTINELTTCSVMGVTTIKGKKPGLNTERREIAEGCMQKIIGPEVKTFSGYSQDILRIYQDQLNASQSNPDILRTFSGYSQDYPRTTNPDIRIIS